MATAMQNGCVYVIAGIRYQLQESLKKLVILSLVDATGKKIQDP